MDLPSEAELEYILRSRPDGVTGLLGTPQWAYDGCRVYRSLPAELASDPVGPMDGKRALRGGMLLPGHRASAWPTARVHDGQPIGIRLVCFERDTGPHRAWFSAAGLRA